MKILCRQQNTAFNWCEIIPTVLKQQVCFIMLAVRYGASLRRGAGNSATNENQNHGSQRLFVIDGHSLWAGLQIPALAGTSSATAWQCIDRKLQLTSGRWCFGCLQILRRKLDPAVCCRLPIASSKNMGSFTTATDDIYTLSTFKYANVILTWCKLFHKTPLINVKYMLYKKKVLTFCKSIFSSNLEIMELLKCVLRAGSRTCVIFIILFTSRHLCIIQFLLQSLFSSLLFETNTRRQSACARDENNSSFAEISLQLIAYTLTKNRFVQRIKIDAKNREYIKQVLGAASLGRPNVHDIQQACLTLCALSLSRSLSLITHKSDLVADANLTGVNRNAWGSVLFGLLSLHSIAGWRKMATVGDMYGTGKWGRTVVVVCSGEVRMGWLWFAS